MIIKFKGSFKIAGDIYYLGDKKYQFKVPTDNKKNIVDVCTGKEKVNAICNIEVSGDLWKIFKDEKIYDPDKLKKELKKEVDCIYGTLTTAAKKVLSLIKYYFKYTHLIKERLIRDIDVLWKTGKSGWKRFTFEHRRVFTNIKVSEALSAYSAKKIQRLVDTEYEPLLALRHLHRAENEEIPRYKWIDATIAAELAIKEALIRIKPELDALLSALPSPPLSKLYGPILKEYAGKSSPKKNQIDKGATIRNELLHHPKEPEISSEKAKKYVKDVEEAIEHLLKNNI